jgi:drug/metabolite transporter (DMT)-like permease
MRRFYATGFLCLLAFDTMAQLAFKQAALDALPMTADLPWIARVLGGTWVWVAVSGYIGAFVSYMTLLRHAPIGPAFAASHLEALVVSALAVPLFGESLGWPQLAGGALILAGIACLAKGEAEEAADDAAA